MSEIKLSSELTCPECGHKSVETMPADSCLYYCECRGCGALLKPKTGDCCVFCSYGSVSCPSIQEARIANQAPGCCDG